MQEGRPLTHWLLLMALVVMWGSSFMLVKVALQAIGPLNLVAGRLVIGAAVLGILLLILGRRLPQGWRMWGFFLAMAVTGNALPFLLISWGQQRIDSGLAGILMAIMPLTTLVLAHFFVAGERLTGVRVAGFLLGFLGIVVLMGPEALLELKGEGTALLSQLSVLGGAVCYAANTVIARRRPACDPMTAATGVMLLAAAMMVPLATLFGGPLHATGAPVAELPAGPLLALIALGLISTALATVVYLKLVTAAGAGFVALINYLIPPWAVLVGTTLLGERPDLSALLALGLILAGIALSEARRGAKR